MMDVKLIIEAGSSKSDWIIYSDKIQECFSLPGINPSTQSFDTLHGTISDAAKSLNIKPLKVYFYGAGCGSAQARDYLGTLLMKFFSASSIHIETDLVAAARACCFGKEGIVCILGTGSHAALSDGHKIIHQLPSLGYILGDEGSSGHMAKLFIRKYFLSAMDEDLKKRAQSEIEELEHDFVYNFYNSPYPVSLLSKIGRFILDYQSHPEIIEIIMASLKEFMEIRLNTYNNLKHLPVHSTGSYAYFLQDKFRELLAASGFKAGVCIQKPISRLIEYHKEYDIN